jgi:hypothetical protein
VRESEGFYLWKSLFCAFHIPFSDEFIYIAFHVPVSDTIPTPYILSKSCPSPQKNLEVSLPLEGQNNEFGWAKSDEFVIITLKLCACQLWTRGKNEAIRKSYFNHNILQTPLKKSNTWLE